MIRIAGMIVAFAFCLVGALAATKPAAEKITCEGEYPPHMQGICTDGTNLYWSHTVEIVKTDASGKRLVSSGRVASHHGDLCWKDGVVYVAVNLGAFNTENKAKSWVYAYRDSDLAFLKKWPLPEAVHGAGGMTAKGDRFYVVGGLPKTHNANYVYEYTSDFTFVKRHVLASGWTNLGIQTVDFQQGHFIFGTYGQKRKEGEKKPPSTMVAPADLSTVRFVEGDYVGEGVVWFKDKIWRAVIRCLNPKEPHAKRRFVSWITPAQFEDPLD